MKIIKDKIEIAELKEMAKRFGDFVKAVVDIEKEIMAVDEELHSDLEEILLKSEKSAPQNLWGINIFPEIQGEEFIKFDSLINLKPGFGNRTMGVDSVEIREKIKKVVDKLVKK